MIDAATLGVGFEIDPGASLANLQRLDTEVDRTTTSAVAALGKVEAAGKTVLDLSAATVSVRTFGTDTTRETASAARALAQLEARGESMVASLAKQNAAFGRTREEVRGLRAEVLAADLSSKGLTELAGRLRAAEAAQAALERAARERAAAEKLAAQTARDDAAALAALRQAVEPLRVAEERLNAEMEQALRLHSLGARSAEEHGRDIQVLAGRLAELKLQQAGATAATGGQRFAMQNLGFQLQDTTTMIVAGTSALRAFAVQAPQAAMALTGFGGALGRVGAFLSGPWGIALTIATTLAAGFADKLFTAEDAADAAAGGTARHGKAAVSTEAAIASLNDELVRAGRTEAQTARLTTESAEALYRKEAATRAQTKAMLVQAQAALELTNALIRMPGGGDAAGAQAGQARKIEEINAKLAAEDAALATARRNVELARSAELRVKVADATDRATASERAATAAQREHVRAIAVVDQATRDQAEATRLATEENAAFERGLATLQERLAGSEAIGGFGVDLSAISDAYERVTAEMERQQDARRRELIDAGQDFADIIGGGFGRAVSSMLPLLERAQELFSAGGSLAKLAMGAGIGGTVASATGGSGIGGSLGGALGGKLGEQFLSQGLASISSSLGQFAGPIGAIAGSLMGGVVGGLLKKTKNASATVEIMAGEAMTASIAGNSGKLKGIAGGLADGLIGGLSGIADQLGGELRSGIATSIGSRKDKFVVDTSGLGRTKGAGTVSFDTEQAAITFAAQNMVQRGVVDGLRAGTDALLRGTGKLETQLAKAVSFEGVFTDLKKRTDPVEFALEEIGKEFAALDKTFREASASAEDFAALAQLRTLKEAEARAQAEKAVEDVSERLRLERELLEVQGDTAALRRLDRDAILPANLALFDRVQALRDEKTAADEAAAAADAERAKVAEVATARASLEQRLAILIEGTAASRRFELEATAPANRAIVERIHAIEDERAAVEAATKAAAEAAEIASRAAAEAQAKVDAIAAQRAGLERQLMEATGDTAGLLKLDRDAIDPANRALFDLIQTRRAEAAAAAEQQRAAEDAARAADQLRDAWASVADGIMEEVRRIRGLSATPSSSFALLQGQFNAATFAARAGDQDAAKSLTGLSREMLDVAAQVATSRQELDRVQAFTAASLESTARLIGGARVAATLSPANDDGSSWWQTTAAAWAAPSAASNGANEVAALNDKVASLETRLMNVLTKIAENTGQSAGVLADASRAAGGPGLAVTGVGGDPVEVSGPGGEAIVTREAA